MKYTTRIHHPAGAPCEFAILDKDPSGEVSYPVPIISAIGRSCTEPDTQFGSSILSQATLEPLGAVGRLKEFQGRHSFVETDLSEDQLRKFAPELGALLGITIESDPDQIQIEAAAFDTNAAVADAFETGASIKEFEA
jgi:hypothetical protein